MSVRRCETRRDSRYLVSNTLLSISSAESISPGLMSLGTLHAMVVLSGMVYGSSEKFEAQIFGVSVNE